MSTEIAELPQKIGNFRVEGQVGEDASALFYAGEHAQLERKVVLKVLRPDLAGSEEAVAQFLAQARIMSRLASAHVPEILDMGQLEDGRSYYTMGAVTGRSLADVIESEPPPFPVWRALHIARGIASALGVAHESGIIHRDLRPQNIVLVFERGDADFVKVLGFGARPGDAASDFTYRSPEQCCGADAEVDARADVYALGAIVYQLLSGELPHAGRTRGELLLAQMTREPRRLREIDAAIPASIEIAVHRALGKDPAARFSSVRELVRALEADDAPAELVAAPTVAPHVAPDLERVSQTMASAAPAEEPLPPRAVPKAALGAVAAAALALIAAIAWPRPHASPTAVVTPVAAPVAAAVVAPVGPPPAPVAAASHEAPGTEGGHDVDFERSSHAAAARRRTASHPRENGKAAEKPAPNGDAKQLLGYPE